MNDRDNECFYITSKRWVQPDHAGGLNLAELEEKKSAWFGRIVLMHSHRLKEKKSRCPSPGGENVPPHFADCPFSSPFPRRPPSLLDLIWPRDLDSPGPRLSHRVPPLPQRIGPITPQPQPDQSSLGSRERSSKKGALMNTPCPPPPLPPPSSPPSSLLQAENRPRWKDLNSRAMALRSPLGSPLNSPSLLLSSN